MKNNRIILILVLLVITLIGTGCFFRESLTGFVNTITSKQIVKNLDLNRAEKKYITKPETILQNKIKTIYPEKELKLKDNERVNDYYFVGDIIYYSLSMNNSNSEIIIRYHTRTKEQTELYKTNESSSMGIENLSANSKNIFWTEEVLKNGEKFSEAYWSNPSERNTKIFTYDLKTKNVSLIKEVKNTQMYVSFYKEYITWFEAISGGEYVTGKMVLYNYKTNKTREIKATQGMRRCQIQDGYILYPKYSKNTLVRESIYDEERFVKLILPKDLELTYAISNNEYIVLFAKALNSEKFVTGNAYVYDVRNSKLTNYVFKAKIKNAYYFCVNKNKLAISGREGFIIIDLVSGKAQTPEISKEPELSFYAFIEPYKNGFTVKRPNGKIDIFE